jgi:single-stranded-DNA-specific exonuclease
MKWKIIENKKSKIKNQKLKVEDVVDILLRNRGIKKDKERKEFFDPSLPEKLSLKSLGINASEISKSLNRIRKAKDKKQKVVVYGDYDADGITATAILWECLYSLGVDAMPYIPERFSEGYGLNAESIRKLKDQNPKLKLMVTVDNGIVANKAVDVAHELGIDVIITDHHLPEKSKPKAYAIVHTKKISGAGLAWILAREIVKKIRNTKYEIRNTLDLVAIGSLADQLPLLGPNRSLVKRGLELLNRTKRPGVLALFNEAGIEPGTINTYVVGFVIAPRINAMGRLKHAIDSLRLLCTKSESKARDLASHLSETNKERQRIVQKVLLHAKTQALKREGKRVIIVAHDSYHEGVIGLVASKLVEEFYRPAIVISQGKSLSKASARSIPGFNIIEAIRELEDILEGGGGHPMAAGFSLATERVDEFLQRFEKISAPLLPSKLMTPEIKIDLELNFNLINQDLVRTILKFEPHGLGNPRPTFATKNVTVLGARAVGNENRHLKLILEKDKKIFDAIAFGFGKYLARVSSDNLVDVAYNLEENSWNGKKNLQLKIKDIKWKRNSKNY